MLSPHTVHDAAAEAARHQRVRATGLLAHATVLAVRRVEVLDGGVSLVELDLRVRVLRDGVVATESMTTIEPISLVLAARARPGARLDVYVSTVPQDGVVIDWSH